MDALLPVGTPLGASHFIAGQHVDIRAETKGKGFAGAMKRHGFKGQPRSHGHSLSHRSVGSIGRQGYSRVLPGKRLPGRMGGVTSIQWNCWVYRYVASLLEELLGLEDVPSGHHLSWRPIVCAFTKHFVAISYRSLQQWILLKHLMRTYLLILHINTCKRT
jgi:ribosomal protein L3